MRLPCGAGSPAGDILIWRLHSDTAEGMHLVGHFSVNSAINRCAGVFDIQQLSVCIFRLAVWHPFFMAAAFGRQVAGSPSCQQRCEAAIVPSCRLTGPCLLCLTLASPCSCSVRFGMWSGARRLIAACQEGMVLLLDASGREEPLTAEDMLLNGADLVCMSATSCGCWDCDGRVGIS